jgi:hypothetical protein
VNLLNFLFLCKTEIHQDLVSSLSLFNNFNNTIIWKLQEKLVANVKLNGIKNLFYILGYTVSFWMAKVMRILNSQEKLCRMDVKAM